MASEADCHFEYINSSSIEGRFVGQGAGRVRGLFERAKRRDRPTIMFFDEFDSIAQKRQLSDASFSSQTLNQILTELDGFEPSSKVFVLAATNFPESLDAAVLRPGRFDKVVRIPSPALSSRTEIAAHYLAKVRHAAEVTPEELARLTSGMTGADISNLVNVAVTNAVRNGRQAAGKEDFDFAVDRLRVGVLNRSIQATTDTLWATAIHEAGHALVSLLNTDSVPMSKVTILSKGQSLGSVQQAHRLRSPEGGVSAVPEPVPGPH